MIRFINTAARKIMLDNAINTYPDECCGFFFGHITGDVKEVHDTMMVDNAKDGDKRRRFVITAKDYMKAERYADENNFQLLGVYHSHPNHPAMPSEHDRVAAQPVFSYIIISIMKGEWADTKSWVLNEQQQFEEEQLSA